MTLEHTLYQERLNEKRGVHLNVLLDQHVRRRLVLTGMRVLLTNMPEKETHLVIMDNGEMWKFLWLIADQSSAIILHSAETNETARLQFVAVYSFSTQSHALFLKNESGANDLAPFSEDLPDLKMVAELMNTEWTAFAAQA